MPDQNAILAAAKSVLADATYTKEPLTREAFVQRVKDRLAQPEPDATPFFLQAREQGGKTIYDNPNQVSDAEPSTWADGFLQSISQQAGEVARSPMLRSAARPDQESASLRLPGQPEGSSKLTTLENLLQLLIPSGVGTAVNAASRYVPEVLKRGGQTALDFAREFKSPTAAVIGGPAKATGKLLSSDVRDLLRGRFTPAPSPSNMGGKLVGQAASPIEDDLASVLAEDMGRSPLPESVELPPRPTLTPGGNPAISEATSAARQSAAPGGRIVNPSSANVGGRLVKPPSTSTPSSLEAELSSMLDEVRQSQPKSVETTPAPNITDPSTARQSGKFKRSQSKGQAGRYESGRPATREWESSSPLEQELLSPGSTPAPSPSTPSAPAKPSSGPSLSEALVGVEADPRKLPERLDATDFTPDDWQAARDMWGSKNVAAMTGKTVDEVQKLAPRKRGRPMYVDQIMREDEARRKMTGE